MSTRFRSTLFAVAALVVAPPAVSQVLGGVGNAVGNTVGGPVGGIGNMVGLPSVLGPTGNDVRGIGRAGTSTLESVGGVAGNVAPESLDLLRRQRLAALISANRGTLDRDERGQPVRKGALLAIDPTGADLAVAARLGFRVTADRADPELGLRTVTLAIPQRSNVRKALDQLRRAAPGMAIDYDHVFEPAGGPLAPAMAAGLAGVAPAARSGGTRIAMIDGGAANHPALARASVSQKGFAGAPAATGHGTAVASLLVGEQGPFRGAARGASLFVADVYGGNPAAGSASAIVQALAWSVSKRPSAITMSIVGPDNRALAAAVRAVQRRGIPIVAAVGNDGPAAPAAYPASYAGVVAVTGVDARGRALMEAGKALHLDYAAPGADMAAAVPGRGFARVRGTSFAAPLAAARIAAVGHSRLAGEARPGKGRVGRGIVCGTCATPPSWLAQNNFTDFGKKSPSAAVLLSAGLAKAVPEMKEIFDDEAYPPDHRRCRCWRGSGSGPAARRRDRCGERRCRRVDRRQHRWQPRRIARRHDRQPRSLGRRFGDEQRDGFAFGRRPLGFGQRQRRPGRHGRRRDQRPGRFGIW
ncbi:S8 family serine peptidase [Sphingomonas rhizophila]|uniref:S8 family serine peptidase n=1 Tax=Sphingomonas rhizophila TaxID=2071607 RepID=UPI001FE36D98|nr:S8 family serine peptidase [Sphingomonas rhizophila]